MLIKRVESISCFQKAEEKQGQLDPIIETVQHTTCLQNY